MQGNILGQSGTSVNNSLFPIYQQTAEPYKKYGVWVKNSEIIKNLYFQKDVSREAVEEATLPYEDIGNRMATVGKNIYLFNGVHNRKYDTVEKEFTDLTNIPYGFKNGAVITIGTDIYLFGSTNLVTHGKKAYKYDTLADEYTRLADSPVYLCGQAITNIGEDIYFFGSSDTDYKYRAYKYNIASNLYTKLADMEYELMNGCAITADAENIRIFAAESAVLNYNTTKNSYTRITSCHSSINSISKLGDKAYVYASFNDSIVMQFEPNTNSFYQYPDISENSVAFTGNSEYLDGIVAANRKLYGVTNDKLYLIKNKIQNKGDGLYIVTNSDMLSKDMSMESILDVKKIVDGNEQEIEVYIGDGKQWNLLN